jgi:hypothetical protein
MFANFDSAVSAAISERLQSYVAAIPIHEERPQLAPDIRKGNFQIADFPVVSDETSPDELERIAI